MHGLRNTLKSSVFFLIISISPLMVFGQNDSKPLPISPINPTYKDCVVLQQKYWKILTAISIKTRECMNQRPLFGVGIDGTCGRSSMAWVQCENIHIEGCAVKSTRDVENKICQAKAQQRRNRDMEKYRQRRADDIEQAKRFKIANNAYEQSQSVMQLIQSPKKFLRRSLSPYPQTLQKIFGPKGTDLNIGLAQDIYRFARNQAKAGTKLTINPLIQEIQYTVLQHVSYVHMDTFNQLDRLLADIAAFNSDIKVQSTPKTPKGQHQPNESLCKVLATC